MTYIHLLIRTKFLYFTFLFVPFTLFKISSTKFVPEGNSTIHWCSLHLKRVAGFTEIWSLIIHLIENMFLWNARIFIFAHESQSIIISQWKCFSQWLLHFYNNSLTFVYKSIEHHTNYRRNLCSRTVISYISSLDSIPSFDIVTFTEYIHQNRN